MDHFLFACIFMSLLAVSSATSAFNPLDQFFNIETQEPANSCNSYCVDTLARIQTQIDLIMNEVQNSAFILTQMRTQMLNDFWEMKNDIRREFTRVHREIDGLKNTNAIIN